MKRIFSIIISMLFLFPLIACSNSGQSNSNGYDPSKTTILDSSGNIACTPQEFITGMNYYIQIAHDAGNHTDVSTVPDYESGEDISLDDGCITLTLSANDNGTVTGFDLIVNRGNTADQKIYEFYAKTITAIMTGDYNAFNEYDDWMYGGKDYKDSYANGYITHDITIQNVTMTAHACGTVDSLEFEGHNNS